MGPARVKGFHFRMTLCTILSKARRVSMVYNFPWVGLTVLGLMRMQPTFIQFFNAYGSDMGPEGVVPKKYKGDVLHVFKGVVRSYQHLLCVCVFRELREVTRIVKQQNMLRQQKHQTWTSIPSPPVRNPAILTLNQVKSSCTHF